VLPLHHGSIIGYCGCKFNAKFPSYKGFFNFFTGVQNGVFKVKTSLYSKEIQTVLSNRDRLAALKNNRREIAFQGTYLQIDKKEMLKTHSQVKTKELFALNY
jgi:hypothetical protein